MAFLAVSNLQALRAFLYSATYTGLLFQKKSFFTLIAQFLITSHAIALALLTTAFCVWIVKILAHYANLLILDRVIIAIFTLGRRNIAGLACLIPIFQNKIFTR